METDPTKYIKEYKEFLKTAKHVRFTKIADIKKEKNYVLCLLTMPYRPCYIYIKGVKHKLEDEHEELHDNKLKEVLNHYFCELPENFIKEKGTERIIIESKAKPNTNSKFWFMKKNKKKTEKIEIDEPELDDDGFEEKDDDDFMEED